MNEIKQPKKSIAYFYGIMLIITILFNLVALPWFAGQQIKQAKEKAPLHAPRKHRPRLTGRWWSW